MENSSKALIIAGTILIVMLVIGAGMYLFNHAAGLSGTVQSKWSQEEVLAFNQKFQKFEGTQKGSRVRELITVVNKSNSENDVKVSISDFVNGDEKNGYYAKSNLINSRNYEVKITEYEYGVVKTITISENNN